MLLAGRGDRAACGTLCERYRGRVRALARRMRCRCDEADDVAQEVFLRVWRAAPEWQPRARFETWLRRVTMNVCRDRAAKRREVPSELAPEVVDAAQDPSRDAYVAELACKLRRALALLPEAQRAAIVLRYFRGFERRDVQAAMGVSAEAVESLVARARRALRFRLRRLERDVVDAPHPHGGAHPRVSGAQPLRASPTPTPSPNGAAESRARGRRAPSPVTFDLNTTTGVGGGAIINSGTLTLTKSRVVSNFAPINGGGINTQPNGVTTVLKSTFLQNRSGGLGGALSNLGTTDMKRCTVTGNTGSAGGGIATGNTQGTLERTEISDNDSDNCSPLNTIAGCTD